MTVRRLTVTATVTVWLHTDKNSVNTVMHSSAGTTVTGVPFGTSFKFKFNFKPGVSRWGPGQKKFQRTRYTESLLLYNAFGKLIPLFIFRERSDACRRQQSASQALRLTEMKRKLT